MDARQVETVPRFRRWRERHGCKACKAEQVTHTMQGSARHARQSEARGVEVPRMEKAWMQDRSRRCRGVEDEKGMDGGKACKASKACKAQCKADRGAGCQGAYKNARIARKSQKHDNISCKLQEEWAREPNVVGGLWPSVGMEQVVSWLGHCKGSADLIHPNT